MLSPVFKCSTNPRVATAHRWTSVDLVAKLNQPTGKLPEIHDLSTTFYNIPFASDLYLPECFYNKDNKWYYAGVYSFFRLEDLTTKEWEALSTEVSSNTLLHIDPRPPKRKTI